MALLTLEHISRFPYSVLFQTPYSVESFSSALSKRTRMRKAHPRHTVRERTHIPAHLRAFLIRVRTRPVHPAPLTDMTGVQGYVHAVAAA
eukprot:751089-Pleurochrysis_carterae.AAC.1